MNFIEQWRVDGISPRAWIHGLPRRRLYERELRMTWIRVGNVVSPTLSFNVIVPSDFLPTLSKPWISSVSSLMGDVLALSLCNMSMPQTLRPDPTI